MQWKSSKILRNKLLKSKELILENKFASAVRNEKTFLDIEDTLSNISLFNSKSAHSQKRIGTEHQDKTFKYRYEVSAHSNEHEHCAELFIVNFF